MAAILSPAKKFGNADGTCTGAGLARRAAYRSAAMEGTSVYGLGHRGEAAAREVETLIDEVLKA